MVIGGHEGEALAELTGGTPFRIDLQDRDALSDAELARLLASSDCGRVHMGASRNADGITSGILDYHVYAVLAVYSIEVDGGSRERVTLLKMRNPWGCSEWTGAWAGDDDQNWARVRASEQERLGSALHRVDDGTFFIAIEDFRTVFTELTTCLCLEDAESGWVHHSAKSAWHGTSAMGREHVDRCPGFVLEIDDDGDCDVIVLLKTASHRPRGLLKPACGVKAFITERDGGVMNDADAFFPLWHSCRVTCKHGFSPLSIYAVAWERGFEDRFCLSVYTSRASRFRPMDSDVGARPPSLSTLALAPSVFGSARVSAPPTPVTPVAQTVSSTPVTLLARATQQVHPSESSVVAWDAPALVDTRAQQVVPSAAQSSVGLVAAPAPSSRSTNSHAESDGVVATAKISHLTISWEEWWCDAAIGGVTFQVRFRDVTTEQWFRMSSKSVATAQTPFELKPAGGLRPCGTFELLLKAIDDDSSEVVKEMDAPLKVTLIQGEISAPSATGGATWIDVWWTWVGASDAKFKLMFREADAENTGFIWVPVKELPTAHTPHRLKTEMLKPLTRYQLYVKVEAGDEEVRSKTVEVLTSAAGPTAKIEGTNALGNSFKVRSKTLRFKHY